MNKKTVKITSKRMLALCAVVALMLVAAVSAYAADVGGVQQTIRAWLHGEERELSVSANEGGGYQYAYTDEDGEHDFAGGGVAMDAFGNERALSPEEVLDGIQADVRKENDGHTRLYYHDKVFDVTDLLNEDGSGKFCFKESDKIFAKTVYLIVESDGSWTVDNDPDGNTADYVLLGN